MKLLIAIIQEPDADRVGQGLRDAGARFTRLSSSGGFLETPNVTLVLAVEEDALPRVLEVFRERCSAREVELPLVLYERLRDWEDRMVSYAGATILVADLSDVVRI